MLSLTFLGVGSAYAKRNFQSNALIEAWSTDPDRQDAPDDTLLIDFGTTGPLALHQLKSEAGFSYLERNGAVHYPAIHRVFITHQHSDHVGGLEELAGINIHSSSNQAGEPGFKPQIIGTAEVLTSLWEHTLKGGLGVLAGRNATLADYFDVLALRSAGRSAFDRFSLLDRYEFTPLPTDHIRMCERYDWPSFGLLITDRKTGATVVYSGDTRFDPDGLGEMMATAKLNFHEVQLDDQHDPVHTTLPQLRTLPVDVRRRTVLFHYGDTWDDKIYDIVADEFAGFARAQERYVLFE